MKRLNAVTLANVFLFASTLCASADSSPAPLLGKSVVVHWTENRDQIVVGTQTRQHINARHTLVVYIASTGKVFSRMTYDSARAASSDQTAGSDDATGYSKRQVLFRNRTMTVTNSFVGGARQIGAVFDAAWSSCSASVRYGHGSGGQPMRQRNLNGQIQQLISISIGETTCEVKDGNALAS